MAPPDIARRVYASIAVQDRNNKVLSVDLAAFVTRLLLFDTYILHSVWLEDLILLQHSCGTHGLAELFESGALKFQVPGFTLGQTGQARQTFNPATPPLPFFNYQFSVLRVQDAEQRVERTIAALTPSLRAELIKGRVAESPQYSATVFEVFYRDVRTDLLDVAVKAELRRMGIIPIDHEIHAAQIGEDEFAVENNLSRRYLLPQNEAHRIIESGMMAIGRMDERLATMRAYGVLTGFSEEDKILLDSKLGAVASLSGSTQREQAFSRAVAIKGLPVPEFGSTELDVKALLKVRESDECKAFKQWLDGSDALSNKELRERVSGLGRRIRQAIHTRTGKTLRFVFSNGLALGLGVTGPAGVAAGLAVSAVDFFLLERLMPKDAVINFLSEGYPSLFDGR